jgi:hypothetical protein
MSSEEDFVKSINDMAWTVYAKCKTILSDLSKDVETPGYNR